MWRGGSDSGVKGDIGCAVLSGSGGDVAAALAIRPGEGPAATMFAGDAINGALQVPWGKYGANFDFVAAFPPSSAKRVNNRLFGRLGLPELFVILFGILG